MESFPNVSTIERDLSTTINTSPLKPQACSSRMASTPMAPNKVVSNSLDLSMPQLNEYHDDILEIVPVVEKLPISKNFGNSALMMVELFGEREEISLFDELRKKLKSLSKSKVKPHLQLQLRYEKVISHFEVLLKNKKEDLLDKIKNIEMNSMKNNNCPSLAPSDIAGTESYGSFKKHLRYIDSLQREFKL